MGVVHKLKKDVIDFILNSKRDNPKLGCRKLAEIASEKFEIKISKSSVNSIIKSQNLSNSVGRPKKPKVEKKKKFEIPTDRKKRISQELTSIPLPVDQPNTDNSITEQDSDTAVALSDKNVAASEKKREKPDEMVINVHSEIVDEKNVQKEISSIKQKFDAVEATPIAHAGLVLLKIAIEENITEEFFENILSGIDLGVDSNSIRKSFQADIFAHALSNSTQQSEIQKSINRFCLNQNKLDIKSIFSEKVVGSDLFSVLARESWK